MEYQTVCNKGELEVKEKSELETIEQEKRN